MRYSYPKRKRGIHDRQILINYSYTVTLGTAANIDKGQGIYMARVLSGGSWGMRSGKWHLSKIHWIHKHLKGFKAPHVYKSAYTKSVYS